MPVHPVSEATEAQRGCRAHPGHTAALCGPGVRSCLISGPVRSTSFPAPTPHLGLLSLMWLIYYVSLPSPQHKLREVSVLLLLGPGTLA